MAVGFEGGGGDGRLTDMKGRNTGNIVGAQQQTSMIASERAMHP